jgi:purine-binding chemotaxis protein CheW
MTQGESEKTGTEYLSFNIGREEYGIEIKKVQEIRGYENVTPLPGVASFIKGVVNLRGAIVPIIDLRIRLSVGTPTYIPSTAVVIIDIKDKFFGIIVDGVSDVINLASEHLRPAPDVSGEQNSFITGRGSFGDRLFILLDIEKLLMDEKNQLITCT